MRITDIIEKKRDGGELTDEEIRFFVNGSADSSIPDYQLSAMLMAMFIRGLSARETLTLTLDMQKSGDTVDLSAVEGIKADKHSTGGVGDKTSLIVAPIVAACGIKMAKMSGRGLGHTGGTVDKLESIPGLQTEVEPQKFIDIVNRCGVCIIGQSGNLCPADKKLYALRDVTATVDNVSLIASSIMSKKLAAGADIIVLDVKCGSGAFMKTTADAEELARKMVEIGTGAGKKTAAMITDMDIPLGYAIGNSLEIIEAVQTLKGQGPQDLTELCISLAAKILQLAGMGSFESCKVISLDKISDGSAFVKLKDFTSALGGDVRYLEDTSLFEKAKASRCVRSASSGFITTMQTGAIGSVCVSLGAGRAKKDDAIDMSAGVILRKKAGDYVEAGEAIAELFANDESRLAAAESEFLAAVSIGNAAPIKNKIVLSVIE